MKLHEKRFIIFSIDVVLVGTYRSVAFVKYFYPISMLIEKHKNTYITCILKNSATVMPCCFMRFLFMTQWPGAVLFVAR